MENHHLAEIRPFGDDFPDTDPSSNVSTFLVIVFHPGSGLCFFWSGGASYFAKS